MPKIYRIELCVFLSFLVVLLVSVWIFNQGVNKSFYFDDLVNLDALGAMGSVDSWESARQFIFGNGSGALGRPISMATFLLDDNTWPSDATSFKKTNIAIHAIIGLLVFWFSLLLARIKSPQYASVIAMFVAAAWLVNPLHVSTVLYPVQRMAQLSTLFAIAGLICYVKGRASFHENDLGKGLFSFALVGICFLLSIFSKENGALLPLLILVVEVWISKAYSWRADWVKHVSYTLIYTGVCLTIGYIIFSIFKNGLFETYPGRTFSPYERLITQPFVMFFYLKELLIPSLFTSGLYYDDVQAFKSIFAGPQVVVSVAALCALAFFGVSLLRKMVFSGLAICFFLAGHLLESTGLNLELIFEHRNYLPSVLLAFVWVDIVLLLKDKIAFGYALLVIPLVAYPAMSLERSNLWQNELILGKYLSVSRPKSTRSQIEYNNALLKLGLIQEARKAITLAVKVNPSNVFLAMQAVVVECLTGTKESKHLEHLLNLAKNNKFDGRDRLIYEEMYKYMNEKRCSILTPRYFSSVLSEFLNNEEDPHKPRTTSGRLLNKYANIFYVHYPEYYPYEVSISDRIMDSGNPEYLMNVAAQLASLGRFNEAIVLSDKALELVRSGDLGASDRKAEVFEAIILDFQAIVQEDIHQQEIH